MGAMPADGKPGRLPETVYRLGWISFWADVCSEMVYPIIPLFLAALGAPAAALGLVEGIAESIVSFMKGWTGLHSDKTGKRAVLIQSGYGLSALGKPIIGLAQVWPFVLLGRAVDRFGKGLRTTGRDTLIADVVEPTSYGRAFGLHRTMDSAGAFLGVMLVAGILFFWPQPNTHQFSRIFLLASIPGAISFFITLKVKDIPRHEQLSNEQRKASWRTLTPAYWTAMAVCAVFALANSSDTFLLLRVKKTGLSDFDVILAYALYNVVYTLLNYPAGKLSDRIGRWWILAFGWLLYAGVYFGVANESAAQVWPLLAFYGLYIGATDGVSKALVADLAPRAAKGSGMGIFYMVTGFATLGASPVAGWLWDSRGPAAAFQFGACVALVAVALIPFAAIAARRYKTGPSSPQPAG